MSLLTKITTTTCLVVALLASVSASTTPPNTGQDWITLEDGTQFQPAAGSTPNGVSNKDVALSMAQERFLRSGATSSDQQGFGYLYLDAQETYYMPWSQAWRYVGFYTDCHGKRMMYDEENEEDNQNNNNNEEEEKEPCLRYLLWAAYIDLDYAGNGVGEYQFFDTYAQEWDASACKVMKNGVTEHEDGTLQVDDTQCKKMDCHLPQSKNWHLLGYFKEYYYTGWFEQLFKHEGYCIWQNGEANFMYNNYYSWPEGCTQSEVTTKDGDVLYYDLKVTVNATMGYGLYTDARCSKDYTGTEVTLSQVMDDNELLSEEDLEYWNGAMEIYKVCQPCRAYTVKAEGKTYNGNNRDLKVKNDGPQDQRELYQDPNNGNFQCYDMAGYTNVNQCMKFKTKTLLEPASIEEVLDAATQDGITQVTIAGRTYGSYNAGLDPKLLRPNWLLLAIGMSVLVAGGFFLAASTWWSYQQWHYHVPGANLKQPLINEEEPMIKDQPTPVSDAKTVGSDDDDDDDKRSSSLSSSKKEEEPKVNENETSNAIQTQKSVDTVDDKSHKSIGNRSLPSLYNL